MSPDRTLMIGTLANALQAMALSKGSRMNMLAMIKCQHLRFGAFKPGFITLALLTRMEA